MNWYYNMRISSKLILAFILGALITGIVGVYGVSNINKIDDSYTQMYNSMTVPIEQLAEISTLFQRIRVETRDVILGDDEKTVDESITLIASYRSKINELSDLLEKTIISQEFRNIHNDFKTSREEYVKHLDKLLVLARANKDKEAFDYLNGEMNASANRERDLIQKMVDFKHEQAKKVADENAAMADRISVYMICMVVFAMVLSVVLGLFISKIISNPLKKALYMIEEMKLGHLTTRLNISTKDEVGQMAKAMDSFADDLKTNVVEVMQKISTGDVNIKVQVKDSKDEITPAIETTISTIKGLVDETGRLIGAIGDGKLDVRGNEDAYQGSWKGIVSGINQLTDAFVGQINLSAEYIDRISHGDIPPRITDNYKGDFNEIKNNINKLIDTLNSLIEEMNNMSKQHDLGDIDVVVDDNKFDGTYKNMAKGINNMVNDHISLNKKAMACITEFVKGNFDAPLEKFPGKKAFINENIELLRQNLKDVNTEINKLIKASEEGNLGERANDKAFKGDWAVLVKGLNGLIEKIIEPVVEASQVLDEMSKGNLKVSVKGNYKGDNAKIKNALNDTISTISGYINDISTVLKQLSDGNLDVDASGDYKGDFVQIKNALNQIIQSFNEVLSNINVAAEQVASGSRQVSSASQSLSQGSTEQASSIEELSASITEIASKTRENAANANQANDISHSAMENASSGNEQMKAMLNSMQQINESSASISKIIKVIDEIAFQTNILALNAAVEAARAGQHGKGFAVVAEEVRNLAARSANAAKETTDLIEGSIEIVEKGTAIANQTANALDKIVIDVEKASKLVSGIAIASNEQATGIAQINKGIEQVSTVIQTNSSTAEESAAASEELSSQAELLKGMVGKFRIKRSSNAMNTTNTRNDGWNYEEANKKQGKSKQQEIVNEFKNKIEFLELEKDFSKY